MVPGPFTRHSFSYRITTSGKTTSRYLFNEVENAAGFAKITITCENNYSR